MIGTRSDGLDRPLLVAPAPLLAIAALLINDHVLKSLATGSRCGASSPIAAAIDASATHCIAPHVIPYAAVAMGHSFTAAKPRPVTIAATRTCLRSRSGPKAGSSSASSRSGK